MTAKTGIFLAGLLGLLGVAAGAFGAHGLRERVDARSLEIWQTGAHYQQVHSVLLLVVAVWALHVGQRGGPTALHGVAMTLLVAGMLVFSGTLYGLTLGGPRVLGAITPLGGLCLLGGWATIALLGLRSAP
jgi:uncharacterized membrane protein YgdD (TMEM256/DUF423 family)